MDASLLHGQQQVLGQGGRVRLTNLKHRRSKQRPALANHTASWNGFIFSTILANSIIDFYSLNTFLFIFLSPK